MLLLKRPFYVCELQDLVLQSCFKSKLLIGSAAEVESSHWPISPHQKHSARCCFLDKIYPYIRHTDGGFVDHLGSCHSQCSCFTPMFKPRDVPAVDPSVWSQTKRKTKKKFLFPVGNKELSPANDITQSVSFFLSSRSKSSTSSLVSSVPFLLPAAHTSRVSDARIRHTTPPVESQGSDWLILR